MKKQTFISQLETKNGEMVNFERWNYRRVTTIKKHLKNLYSDYKGVYEKDLEKSHYITIYATPDGYTKEEQPVFKISIKEFLNN